MIFRLEFAWSSPEVRLSCKKPSAIDYWSCSTACTVVHRREFFLSLLFHFAMKLPPLHLAPLLASRAMPLQQRPNGCLSFRMRLSYMCVCACHSPFRMLLSERLSKWKQFPNNMNRCRCCLFCTSRRVACSTVRRQIRALFGQRNQKRTIVHSAHTRCTHTQTDLSATTTTTTMQLLKNRTTINVVFIIGFFFFFCFGS